MSDLDARLSDAARAVADIGPSRDLWAEALERSSAIGDVRDLTISPEPRLYVRPLAIGTVAACLLAAAFVLANSDRVRQTTDPAAEPTERPQDAATITAEDVEIAGWSDDPLPRLSIDAVVQGGAASGQFRVGAVVVDLECAAGRTPTGNSLDGRDVILGGRVTGNGERLTILDEVGITTGSYVALIIREALPAGQRVTLFEPSLWTETAPPATSCRELVDAVPDSLDGGFFTEVVGTIAIH